MMKLCLFSVVVVFVLVVCFFSENVIDLDVLVFGEGVFVDGLV